MQSVTVKKADLLTTLTMNRESHIKEYDKAFSEYQEAAKVEVSALLQKIEEGRPFNLHSLNLDVMIKIMIGHSAW